MSGREPTPSDGVVSGAFVSSHGHGTVFQKFLDNLGPLRSQSVIICIECMGPKNKAKIPIALGIKKKNHKDTLKQKYIK